MQPPSPVPPPPNISEEIGRKSRMETNPLTTPHADDPITGPDLHLGNPSLKKITRIRLLSDPGCPFWDVSYVHGVDDQGRKVRVITPGTWFQIPKSEGPVRYLLRISPELRRLCYV